MKRYLQISITAWMVSCFLTSQAQEDEVKKSKVDVKSSATLTSNFYSSSGIDPRQPTNMQYGIIKTSVMLWNMVELPFELYFTTGQTQFQQPFNQFGVSPKISNWLTLHAGYFSTRFSDLTFGDMRLLGGGFELTPGNFRLKAIYGRSQKAVEPDKVSFAPGVYRQNAYAVSIGYGNLSKSYFNINLFHAKDDSTSVKRDSININPSENIVTSVDFGICIGKYITLKGEGSVSAFSSNLRSEKLDNIKENIPELLFTPNASSRIDGAGLLSIDITPSAYWSVSLGTRWIGPGFNTLGYALMPNDLFEYTISPRFRLFKNKLILRSRIGLRYNNLRNNRMATTSRFTGMVNVTYQITSAIGIDGNYSKNQIESGHKIDTLRISNVFDSYTLTPRLSFQAFRGNNNVMLTFSYQNSSDKNAYTQNLNNVKTRGVNVIHILAFSSSLSLSTTLLYNKTSMDLYTSTITHASETVGKRFFKDRLNTSLSIGVNWVEVTDKNTQLVFRLNATYNLKKYGSLSFFITNNSYRGYGVISQKYNEIYGNIQYNINF
jgi:hypothetical protein